jgi:hypothetical protein
MLFRHLANQQERFILYQVDHAAFGKALRDFGEQRRWYPDDFDPGNTLVPDAVRVLHPSGISVYHDYVEVNFGGPFLDISFRAFRPGVSGYGTKRLGDGLWFYSEDGSCPSE